MKRSVKIHAAAYTALGLALVFCTVMWGRSYKRNRQLDTEVNNSYDRAFFELTDYVNNIDALLSKAQLAATPAELASLSNEIFMQSSAAKACFGQLPQGEIKLESTARFLSQVGDYTYVLSQNMINGAEITDEEYKTLAKLNDYASKLGQGLGDIENRIFTGEIDLKTASADVFTTVFAADTSIFDDLENVEHAFDGYPSLIYDGPFSEHIENMESYMLKTAPELSRDEALIKAKEFLGERGDRLEFENELNGTAIDTYNFSSYSRDGMVTVSVTKRGGYVLFFTDTRDVSKQELDITAASERAMSFLKSRGIEDMTESYYETKNNIATINFAYSQAGIKCYSDLIKVRVALDNGEIVGMESRGYLMNHRMREIPQNVMTPDEARERVSSHLYVRDAVPAIIPKDSLREVFCYEFKGEYAGKNFLVYINAENGREEDILLLLESDTGVLTV